MFIQEKINANTLYGFSIQHTLDDDVNLKLISKLKKQVISVSECSYEELILVQIYGDLFDVSGEFVSFVGVKNKFENSNVTALTIPEGEYLKYQHTLEESEIDQAYEEIYKAIENKNIKSTGNFDFEVFESDSNGISIFIPIENQQILL